MKIRAAIALAVWEIVVIGYLSLLMFLRGVPLDAEKQRMFLESASAGVVVVLLVWCLCRVLSTRMAVGVGFIVGLVSPPALGLAVGQMANYWQSSWGHYMSPLELWSLALAISIPSGVAAAIIGVLVHRRSDDATS